eukprot:TRINITY_DN56365_c0_g1_i1.p1 TRINITY_DN56365_c0_g1~~TRINITY_DN56365_c0_g1_i1.p1  ORF type:complete len:252 (-),score=46.16 TRINITY_DN56365_c0_g1_i1:54-809(-)
MGASVSAKVTIHVYSVGSTEGHKILGKVLNAVGTGAYHCGVEVFGQEWSYGQTMGDCTGLFVCVPRTNEQHSYVESIAAGETSLSQRAFYSLLQELKGQWRGNEYDLLRRNCCHFANELLRRLELPLLPAWITNMAKAADAIGSNGNGAIRHLNNTLGSVCRSNRGSEGKERDWREQAAWPSLGWVHSQVCSSKSNVNFDVDAAQKAHTRRFEEVLVENEEKWRRLTSARSVTFEDDLPHYVTCALFSWSS